MNWKEELAIYKESVQSSWLGTTIGVVVWVLVYQVMHFIDYRRHYIKYRDIPKIEMIDLPKDENDDGLTELPDSIDAVEPELTDTEAEEESGLQTPTIVDIVDESELTPDHVLPKLDVNKVNRSTYLTRNFQLHEFLSRDGTLPTQVELDNMIRVAWNLQKLRDYINTGRVAVEVKIIRFVHVNSGHRSKSHNATIPNAAPGSKHVSAEGADFWVDGYTPKQLGLIIEHLIKNGIMEQGGLAIYSTHVHYDVRGYKARW